jgi:hypothetical protein
MATDGESFEQWLDQAKISQRMRTPERRAVLQAALAFLGQAGQDYASRRIAAHFLLNCKLDLKLAQVARLVGFTRPTASRQKRLSSRQVVGEIQHRLSGRPYGKLLPRYAGPIAQFLLSHPDACREDLLDFIEKTWGVRVGLTALHNFLKKYGLDRQSLDESTADERPHVVTDEAALLKVLDQPPVSGLPVPRPPDDFFSAILNLPVPSSYSPKYSAGGTSPKRASPMTTARSSVVS